jgi:L-lactate dehydrogenase (cytochrome)
MTKLSRAVISSRVVSIADLRSRARRRLPTAVFDYLDGGAEGEVTLRENCRVFEDVTFRPRQAVTVPGCELCTRFLGLELSFPALLAPVGYSRLMHPGGEVAAARAAGLAGTAYILSTISDTPWKTSKQVPPDLSSTNSTCWAGEWPPRAR